ncbi:MAG: gluconate 2-dehydrogenase subunit 3 family protein [Lewinellaceae bacterium]|nr:gluconate 2-dehydrogenase subunit 3 family protein [Saprospiraceae bacterium]MCB9342395.1 gluconate 2-dehydrogenase subunit 3 family protein [Lewinellaceae bacterium]
MNRRELLQKSALMIGGTLAGADSLLAKNIHWEAMDSDVIDEEGIGIFSKAQIKLINEVADTIIPTTDTPGAKAAKAGQFIAVVISDCYDAEGQQNFLDGLTTLDQACKKANRKTFMRCSKLQKHDLLVKLDDEQKAFYEDKNRPTGNHYFRAMKDLVLWAYFTSEIGATQALRFVEYPGRYETIDYKKGDRAFSS